MVSSTSGDERVVVAAGARTPIGRFGGAFRSTPAHELGAVCIRAALERALVKPAEVDEVVLGCVGQVGPDIFNARRATLAAGLPPSTPAYNVNRLCGSGLQALWEARAELLGRQADIVVAGGNENMTMQPFLDFGARNGYKLGDRTLLDGALALVTDPWGNYPMGVTAEHVAQKFNVSREEQDCFALESQRRAARALDAGLFQEQIVGVHAHTPHGPQTVTRDEHPRPDTTLETLAALRPVFQANGTVTAGNSSGINDAAAALVVMRETTAIARGIPPLGRFVAFARVAIEPEIMGYAPTYAVQRVLQITNLRVQDIGLVELNEAFAAQAVAVIRDTQFDPNLVNPNGGAIALGHPIGATGAILVLKLLYELRRRQCEWGLVTMCIGGGQALAALFQLI
jgi:acetyl-CoA C-acetyltransferase